MTSETTQAAKGPDFKAPPVAETALGIQFAELAGFRTIHFGQFYELVRERYPQVEEHPRLDPIVETFPKSALVPGFRFQTKPRVERNWFLDKDGGSLLQLQADRFGFNWRSPDQEAKYPRYSVNLGKCLEEYDRFVRFCEGTPELGEIKPTLTEVVYVNHIFPDAENGETAIDLMPQIFTGIRWDHSDEFLPKPETASLNRAYVIDNGRGRLYAEAAIASRKDGRELIQLRMVGRALHDPDSAVAETLQLAHDWVVNGFVSLTSNEIRQRRWRQIS